MNKNAAKSMKNPKNQSFSGTIEFFERFSWFFSQIFAKTLPFRSEKLIEIKDFTPGQAKIHLKTVKDFLIKSEDITFKSIKIVPHFPSLPARNHAQEDEATFQQQQQQHA